MRCRFVKKLFGSESSGYTVAVYGTRESIPMSVVSRYSLPGHRCFTAVGSGLPCNEAIEADLEGEWKTGKYGLQFHVSCHQEVLPSTAEGIESYLGSGLLKGFGPGIAARIVARFGEKSFEVLETQPEKLLEIPGITPDRLKTALECYEASRELRGIVAFLSPFGVTPNKAMKIYDVFGVDSVEKLKENPYLLTSIHGFGFKTADSIARHLGVPADDPQRIGEGVLYALEDACGSGGHVFFPVEKLVKRGVKLLNDDYEGTPVSEASVNEAIYRLVVKSRLVHEGECLYTTESYEAEVNTAADTAKLIAAAHSAEAVEGRITALERELHVILSPLQRQAVRQAFTYGFSIITGGPGTGKTTILRFITWIYRALNPAKQMTLMAPTGLAARRMADSTGETAQTIHSAFCISPDHEREQDEGPIQSDFVIIDECSMIDQRLASRIFARIDPHTRVLLVGDADQLPSVGPGNVFRDFIDSGVIPVTKLDTIFRQAGMSRIISNAHAINTGSCALDFSHGEFRLSPCETSEEAAGLVVEEYLKALKENPMESIQILTPLRKQSIAGSEALNDVIREKVNPSAPGRAEVTYLGRLFREGDRVMQTRNRKNVSNGDIGSIVSIVPDEGEGVIVLVSFSDGRQVRYPQTHLEDLTLAYAVTIHKSQGNEWGTVIVPVVMSFYRMLQRNLIYTAVTRAKNNVVLVGNKKALFTAVKSNKGNARNTALAERLRLAVGEAELQELKPAV